MNFKKIFFSLFCFLFFTLSVKASNGGLSLIIDCNSAKPGETATCSFELNTKSPIFCIQSIGSNCPESVEEPLSAPFKSSLTINNSFTLKSCSANSGNASCKIENNRIIISPNNYPFNGIITGSLNIFVSESTRPDYYYIDNEKETFTINVESATTTTKKTTTTTKTTTINSTTKKSTTVPSTKKTTIKNTTKQNNITTISSTTTNNEKEYGLIDLKTSYGKLNFKKDIYNYKITIPYDVTDLDFIKTLKDDTIIIDIIGNKDLKVGNNLIILKVKKDNKIIDTYNIDVIRLEKNKCYINNIDIKDHDLKFNINKKEYNLETKEDKLKIEVSLNDNCNGYDILNNNDLKNNSKITIIIKDENKNNLVYTIDIKKKYNTIGILLLLGITVIIGTAIFIILKRRKSDKKVN